MEQPLSFYLKKYQEQLAIGHVEIAYNAIQDFMSHLRVHFTKKYAYFLSVGNGQEGRMDMSYFTLIPNNLKQKKLKIVLIFNHKDFQFEMWLVGQNKQIQLKYWELLKESHWKNYPISGKAQDAIVDFTLIKHPDFNDLKSLTNQIATETIKFSEAVIEALAEVP